MAGLRRGLVVGACIALLAGISMAQESVPPPGEVNPNEAIQVGPFIFSPALELTWESRDNIFFSPDNEVDDTVYLARARLMFELPIYESYLRFSYTPQYRDYGDYDLRENWSHFVDVAGAFEFPSGLKLTTTYRFVSGNLETREVDPGGELMFGDRQFDKHDFNIRADYWMSQVNGLSVEAGYVDLSYDKPAFFYDYTRSRYGLGWLHQMSRTLVFEARYRHETFDADDTAQYRDSDSDELMFGFRGEVNPVLTSTLEIGWRSTNFDTHPGDPALDDFSGLAARGALMWQLAHGSELQLELIRQDYPSNYDLNAYYTSTGGSLAYRLQRERLFGHIKFSYRNNDYDVPDSLTGRSRSDDITAFGLGLGYRFNELLSLRGSYTHQERDTLHRYSYTANMFLVGLVVGF